LGVLKNRNTAGPVAQPPRQVEKNLETSSLAFKGDSFRHRDSVRRGLLVALSLAQWRNAPEP